MTSDIAHRCDRVRVDVRRLLIDGGLTRLSLLVGVLDELVEHVQVDGVVAHLFRFLADDGARPDRARSGTIAGSGRRYAGRLLHGSSSGHERGCRCAL